MLTDLKPVLPASDLARARAFYHDALGLDPTEDHDGMLVYRAAGHAFEIYETPNAGTARNTQISFSTDDLDAEMAALRSHGIQFDDVEVDGMHTVDGVASLPDGSRTSWFHDSEGNILCLMQPA